MKWKDLTPEMLRKLANLLEDESYNMALDGEADEETQKTQGFDVVTGYQVVARRLRREAKRRDAKQSQHGGTPS
jgi:hypothetical protein